jgi:short-subunit dehydrogenase
LGLIARSAEALEATCREVEALGGEALPLPGDVADARVVEEAAARVEARFGPIDVWINNAMVSVFSRFQDMTLDEFRRVNDVTYLGYVYGTHSALKRMVPRGRGAVVQVGSALAYRAIPLQSAYCGAKHAIQGFTESIRSELIAQGSPVTVTMVQLPAVNTPQFSWVRSRLPKQAQPVEPIFQPEPIAEAIYRAAHRRRREWHLGWSAARVILLNKFFAGLGDRYLARVGIEGQQTELPERPDRPDNLWTPMPAQYYATRGTFDGEARSRMFQPWLSLYRAPLLLGAGAIGLALWSRYRGPRRAAERRDAKTIENRRVA